MSTKRFSKEAKIGLFTLLIVVALYITIQFLTGRDAFKGTRTFYAIYPSVEGLTPTSPVSILGLAAGTVDQIVFEPDSRQMIVRMRLEKTYDVPVGSLAEIHSADILGGKAVRIVLSNNTALHHSGDTLAASIQPDLMGMLTTELMGLKDQLATLLDGVTTTVSRLNLLLNQENTENISQTLAQLKSAMDGLSSFAQTLDQNSTRIDAIVQDVNGLSQQLEPAMAQLNKTLANLASLSEQVKDTPLAQTVDGLKTLLEQLSNPEGSLGRLMETPDLYDNLNGVLQKVDTLVQRISDNPKKYIKISVF